MCSACRQTALAGDPPAVISIDAGKPVGVISGGLFTKNHRFSRGGFGLIDLATGEAKPGIIALLKRLGVTGLRFPGGTLGESYDWTLGVGPYGERKKGYEYGIMEHMRIVEALGPEAVRWTCITMRKDGLTPENAADLVEFCNAPGDGGNPNGGVDWAARRAELGHPAPYGIHWWTHSNESGQTRTAAAVTVAVRRVDPTIAYGAGSRHVANEPEVRCFDFIDDHQCETSGGDRKPAYGTLVQHAYDYQRMLLLPTKLAGCPQPTIGADGRLVRGRGDPRQIPFISLETYHSGWQKTYPGDLRGTLSQALTAAVAWMGSIERNLVFQSFGLLVTTTQDPFFSPGWDLVVPDGGGNPYLTPVGLTQSIFATRLGRNRVACAVSGSPPLEVQLPSDIRWLKQPAPMPVLRAIAGVSADGRTLDLVVVNLDPVRDVPVRCDIAGFVAAPLAELWTLTGASLSAANTPEQPAQVAIRESAGVPVASLPSQGVCPARSIIAIRMTRGGP